MWKRIAKIGVTVALLVGMSGCIVTPSSMNVQRSALRGSGDGGITMVLESQDEVDAPTTAQGVTFVCNDVLDFLSTGNVADLTKGELRAGLLKLVSADSKGFVDDVLALVSVSNVDVQGIGEKNVKRIRAFVKGIIRGATEYKTEDR